MDEALNVFRGIEKQAVHNQFYIKPNRSSRLTSRTLNSQLALKELLMPLWNLSRPWQVSVKNKVSTSLKFQGIFYVANTPDFALKVLTKPTLSIVRCTKEKNKHPLKFNLN